MAQSLKQPCSMTVSFSKYCHFIETRRRSNEFDNHKLEVSPYRSAAGVGFEMVDQTTEAGALSVEMQALDRAFATIAFAPDGTILRANANFLALFGYNSGDLVGRHHAIFVPMDHATFAEDQTFWAALQRGERQSAEYLRVRKDGSDIWIQATYTPVVDLDGRASEVVQFATDVTAAKLRAADEQGQIKAINASQAVVHFALDGTITDVNDLFLQAMGYTLDEVLGQHHRMFVESSHAESADYAAFWADLAKGIHQVAEYRRLGKDGREVWLQASYAPIFDLNGIPFKVVKYATDVTHERRRQADYEGQIAAIHKSQAVITFDMHGTVIEANDHFLEATGYRLDEVEGRHHRMFVEPAYAHGPEYATFWNELSLGHHQAGEYRRVGKNGREVWLQATYNPVFDLNGRPFKVVKYATLVTREKLRQADLQGQIASIHKAQSVISFSLDGTILDANDNFLAVTGYRLGEIRHRHHRMFVDKETAEGPDYAAFWAALAKGKHQTSDFKRLGKDGREIWLQATYNPIFDMNGRPFKVVKYAIDITKERLRQADYEGQIAAIHKSQCVVVFDMDGMILDANDNFLDAMGYRLDEIKGHHHRMFVEPGFADMAQYAEFWDTLRSGSFLSAKVKRIGKRGREVWIQATYNPILDLNGRPFKIIKLASDITADVALATNFNNAKQQAEHDATTGLPNRVKLASFMSDALAKPDARLAVLYMDLDHFKPINDTFGHHVGDHVLRETADRLRRMLAKDQIVARIGGDEFVLAAPNLTDAEIETLCRRLIAIVKAPLSYEKGTITVGLSIGVAVSPGDAGTSDALLRCADVALYRSKGSGRGSYRLFTNNIDDEVTANRHLADDMLHGIKAGEFFVEYQPRFNARTKRVQGVEALVRWAHPERGRIEPLDFIPIAEESGLILPLGEWVLRTACHAVAAWPGIGLSVNVSPVQFRSSDLAETISAILSETGLAPERLELEITEQALLENEERAHAVLDVMKLLGVRLAMDSFGPGSSSLGYLRSFPFDGIKIDRRFIADIDKQEGGRAIVQSMLGLGKSLGISVTAEGVESPGQYLLLRLDDCSEVQGFLLASPMSAAAISELLTQDKLPATATG